MHRYLAAALAASLLGGSGAAMAHTPDATASRQPVGHARDAGDRETRALNLLEANGYTTIRDIRAVGPHFEATVMKDGKAITVTVDPATGAVRA